MPFPTVILSGAKDLGGNSRAPPRSCGSPGAARRMAVGRKADLRIFGVRAQSNVFLTHYTSLYSREVKYALPHWRFIRTTAYSMASRFQTFRVASRRAIPS